MAITLTEDQTAYVKSAVAAAGANKVPPFYAAYVLAWQTKLGVVLADHDGVLQTTATVRARNGWNEDDAKFRATVADLIVACEAAWPSVS